jgi:hypothetical protein
MPAAFFFILWVAWSKVVAGLPSDLSSSSLQMHLLEVVVHCVACGHWVLQL